MQQYGDISVWKNIQDIIIEWIESVIREGETLYRGKIAIDQMAMILAERIALILDKDISINSNKHSLIALTFHPVIYTWVDNILLTKWDFYRNQSKFKEFAISISEDLIQTFKEEEKKII